MKGTGMQIVIEMPENLYKTICENEYGVHQGRIYEIIRNGAPLPKGHGRLVDISKIDEDRIDDDNPIIYLTVDGEYIEAVSLDYLNDLPTIIEADKSGSEE